jgi:hypothetical protein
VSPYEGAVCVVSCVWLQNESTDIVQGRYCLHAVARLCDRDAVRAELYIADDTTFISSGNGQGP